ncbi:LEF-8 [Alphabaculovirus altermyunipunctae]|uniref:DNA-directed RNA polymerase n=3 Tax=Mythimna unipuncta nucleopolyhedrovirus TaxID=447897 RepID=A0A346TPH5_9ABAC|nr:LEF-8 [Mythimna unipuncta nucleopolyhedrovirus]AXU41485.1 LEF-8 [Mythimna unipuncta nucleopolyhedrovirus]
MTDVLEDFNELYESLERDYGLCFYLNCLDKSADQCSIKYLQERKSYFCCALDSLGRCVLHRCVLIVFGTRLDERFRRGDTHDIGNLCGTFVIDGRHLSFPNVMMNNNILIHNFYDKLYSKSCKRMFLYGNVDEEKKINRAIQLVYDKHDDILFARDVYAKDYVVTANLNEILETYLKSSGKWEPLNFLFNFGKNQANELFDQIKRIMRSDINYSIDSLSNKIIYKHAYLMSLIYRPILKMYDVLVQNERSAKNANSICDQRKKKLQTILYPKDCKKIVDTIVNGKLIHGVSKTFSKQKKNFLNYQDNSSNNNIEINPPPLKYRIGNEVIRITNDNMRQDMLMHKSDFVKFVDSFFHGEMTVAGKKFFLCRDVRLPNVDYQAVADKFRTLASAGIIMTNEQIQNGSTYANETITDWLMIAFNDRPTIYKCRRKHLAYLTYELKRNRFPAEIKLNSNILFVNHHEGMICIKRTIRIERDGETDTRIVALLTPYEYHNSESIMRQVNGLIIEEENHVSNLMSKLVQYYYRGFLKMFATTPVPKLIVSVTNLKNAMPVMAYKNDCDQQTVLNMLPMGNSVIVDKRIVQNNKMFKLWTLVRDSRLMTAEDPYIPDVLLPIRLYNNKIVKLRGKLFYAKHESPLIKFERAEKCSVVQLPCGYVLVMFGAIVSNVKINWTYDGKRCKLEQCRSQNTYSVCKLFVFCRETKDQKIERVSVEMNICNDLVNIKLVLITSSSDLSGLKICGIHGQKGVLNQSEDLREWMTEDGISAQICLSPISFLSRQSNFDDVEVKYVVRGGDHSDPDAVRYPIFNIPYMLFINTPDNIFKEFLRNNITGHEKVEGTRLDQWSINQSFAGNRLSESLQYIRGGTNLPDVCGEYNVLSSLLHCNNAIIT